MKESLERINVISNIEHLKRIVENPDDEVHIGGDYKAIAPQSLIKKHKKEFKFFIAELSEKIASCL